jgi:hypothetical protein
VKSWSLRPTSGLASFVEVFWKLIRFQPCRSRASPPAAPRRPPAQDLRAPIAYPPASTGGGSASGTSFGEFGVFPLALPPGGHGLNKKLFDDRPLFLLTPQPPRRLWSIRTLRGKVLRQRLGHPLESSAPLSQWANQSQGHCRPVEVVRRVRKLQRGLQKLRQRNAHGPFRLVRERMPPPSR